MNRFLDLSFFLFSFALFTSFSTAQLVPGVIQSGITTTIQGLETTKRISFTVPNDQRPSFLNFTLFTCFGEMDWFLASGYLPNPNGNNTCDAFWKGNDKKRSACSVPRPINGTTYYVLIKGRGQFAGSDVYSSIMDVLLFTSNDQYEALVPQPGSEGTVQTKLKDAVKKRDKQELTMTWTGTGNANDVYSVWIYEGKTPDNSGFLYATGCGVKYYMTQRTDVTIKDNGDGTYTTVVTGLDPVEASTVVIVVDRPSGYTNSYRAILVNDSTKNIVSLLLISLCFISLYFL